MLLCQYMEERKYEVLIKPQYQPQQYLKGTKLTTVPTTTAPTKYNEWKKPTNEWKTPTNSVWGAAQASEVVTMFRRNQPELDLSAFDIKAVQLAGL